MTDCTLDRPASPTTARLAALGNWMRDHQRALRLTQWCVVVFYLVLVALPAFLPLPGNESRILNNVTVFSQFLFWGIWWPFVLLSMILVGRTWCGVFCPEGALSEWASRHGRGAPVPRWAKWGGWPFVAFCLTTVFGQLVSVYQYPKAVLLILGGSTVGAMVIGYLYGKGKRVWCRHLCPVNGVFGLLSRLSPFYMQVDRKRWAVEPGRKVIPINCAPLVDIRRMEGPSECHMCGRCADHRGAVQLAARAPNREIAQLRAEQGSGWDLLLLVYGLMGVAVGAFQWTSSPWFISAKQTAAEWLIERDILWPLSDNAPWWLLTHYPENSDVFTWLDGAMIVAYIGSVAVLLGTWVLAWLAASARVLPGSWRANTIKLSYALTPLAGCGVFLGLSALTVSILKAEGLTFHWIAQARMTLLTLAALWSWWLAWRQMQPQGPLRALAGAVLLVPALAAVVWAWALLFVIW
ncbi:4Fe-4S binding protein [Chitinivorax sp. PXF-14]|uniref:4Fe-4S binding protein n=1 Tax=Chitinivorax sp. PXF-14 TaxID=3230488 RepID=UPI0034652973